MALLPIPLNSLAASSSSTSCASSSSLYFLLIQSRYHNSKTCKFGICCSRGSARAAPEAARKKRKPRPSFFNQIRDKWSMRVDSEREKFPWQETEKQESEEVGEVEDRPRLQSSSGGVASESVSHSSGGPGLAGFSISPPWVYGRNPRNEFGDVDEVGEFGGKYVANGNDGTTEKKAVRFDTMAIGLSRNEKKTMVGGVKMVSFSRKFENLEGSRDSNNSSGDLPWKIERDVKDADRKRRSNTEAAEKTLPEHELHRLRNVALRMLERTKVGVAGITQALVDSIHQKWRVDEVVKLKFEEPLSLNMRRTHEILERRTGGLVIWRSGSSIVLYRGISYKLPCVRSYNEHSTASISQHSSDIEHGTTYDVRVKSSFGARETYNPESEEYLKNLSKKELMDLTELNSLLDELGPRFKDWSGREPLPVDADLLPSVVPGYKCPLRYVPHGMRQQLKEKEMTDYRRLARTVPPHFALGRSRELQGLAKAMVMLWEKSAIAKIAVKRGVQNTRNEMMAEELKKLTGGTLLSRNKEYIVFYRGHDFLPPAIKETLKERQKLAELRQDEEELARHKALASIASDAKASKRPSVAGTLAETMAATSRWGSQPSNEDLVNMRKESVLTKHAVLVGHLEKKLAAAKAKARKADIALAKVQKYLEPTELPTDLETLTDEERFLFRKMGLSMKPFLLLGRRGIFDGTIENMHLHWKFREIVKIIVRGKNFAQVKHVAISLEAESGGVLVSLDKTTKGYAIIVYRGKNYMRPTEMKPRNLLTKRQALARSIELQRREALKHHISDLLDQIELLSAELEDMRKGKIDVKKSYSRLDDIDSSSDDMEEVEVEGEEAYLETYDCGNDDNYSENEESEETMLQNEHTSGSPNQLKDTN